MYTVGSNSTYIVFSTEIGENYTLRYNYFIEDIDVRGTPIARIHVNQNKYINIHPISGSQNFRLNEHGFIPFAMEIDGFLILTGYNRGDNEHITTFNPQERYEDLIVTSFVESPWVIKPEPLTTADALEVLRAVAGLTALTDAESARFGINGEATTADAVRILWSVAGL